ncbi:MAG: S49 family peptidase, partial [FCB group bacterium]|nr:S49 family peptidase [FCB group bacterium]
MMKYLKIILIVLLLSGIAAAEVGFTIPDYYRQSDFLNSTPGVTADAAGGFFNPAVWGALQGPEAQFFWTDYDRPDSSWNNWALMLGVPNLGFGMQQWEFESGGKSHTLTDYNVGLGFGDKQFYSGFSYRWSKGYIPADSPRDDILSSGILSRPCRYASIGAVLNYALNQKDFQAVFDLGIRPFGTPLLTLFGDLVIADTSAADEWHWTAGAAIQPIPGVNLFAKYIDSYDYLNSGDYIGGDGNDDNHAFMAGISLNIGSFGASFTPHFDSEREQVYNTYGVRIGKPYRNFVEPIALKDKVYLKCEPKGPIKYQRYKIFDTGGTTLMGMLSTLEKVKNDDRVAGVAINMSQLYGNWEMAWELREKLLELRESGKKVVIFLEREGFWGYYFASAADRIVIDPQGMLMIIGLNMGRTYMKNMLEKIGIGVDEWRLFTYKSAFEDLSRTSMSEADREQRQALLDDLYEVVKKDVAKARGISEEEFDNIVNNHTLLMPDSAVHYNLVDAVGRWKDIDDQIKELEGEKKTGIGLGAFYNMQYIDEEWGIPPQIALIYGLGVCAMDEGIKGRTLPGVIESAANNKSVKAIVFRADSPGGDPLPSDLVAEALKEASEKKPVIVSQGIVAASGGYWISMYGDKIVASPLSITGSIGVIGGWIWDDGFGDKIGFTYDNTQVGAHADIGSGIRLPLIGEQIPSRNLTQEERKVVTDAMLNMYNDFTKKVADGRGMTPEEVDKIGQGRIWSGIDGKEIGLVDELGGLETAIDIAKDSAGIKSKRKIRLVEMPERGMFDPAMFQPKLLGYKLKTQPENASYEEIYYKMLLES